MGLTGVKALCECNGTGPPTHHAVKCYISAKDIPPSCSPLLKATTRSRCSVRHMLFSTFILLIIMALIYFYSFAYEHRPSLNIPYLRMPQSWQAAMHSRSPGRSENVDEQPPAEE